MADRLAGLTDAADIAAVLLRLAPSDERTLINRVKTLAAPLQARNVAVLLDGHAEIVARAGADGVQLRGPEAIRDTVNAFKPARMVGAGGLHSRHDSMMAGEAGADYLLFGEPDEHGRRPPFAALVERLAWWAELFETPCVGYAATLDEIGPLAATGAEFIMIDDALWNDPRGGKAALQTAMAAITAASAQPVAPDLMKP